MTRPLEGCRVLDLGIITAGAATAALLADLGADVIKIESPGYRDPFREWSPPVGGPAVAPFFRCTNRGKRGISLDLKQPAGRDAFMRLVAESHVVVENFRRGVLDRLGIGFPALRAANEAIILASISSQGETGPLAGYVSFGSTLEAVGGLASITGPADGAPVVSGKEVNLPDQLIAIFAAAAIATAWLARGEAVHLDLSQRELTSFFVGEHFAAPAARSGNAQPPYALQDCIRARDGWLALSVLPEQLTLLGALTGGDLSAWTAARNAGEAADALGRSGIAAALVLDGAGVLAAKGEHWADAMVDSEFGLLKGMPFRLGAAPLHVSRDAPAPGADTRAVLAEIGGLTPEEIDALLATGAAEGV